MYSVYSLEANSFSYIVKIYTLCIYDMYYAVFICSNSVSIIEMYMCVSKSFLILPHVH